MIFLEYVVRKLMGEPEYRRGEWRWTCPKCQSRAFRVRPPKDGCKDRWSCWSCLAWGDDHDLLKHFKPRMTYDERKDALEGWLKEFDSSGYSSPGDRGVRVIRSLLKQETVCIDDLLEVIADYRVKREQHADRLLLGKDKKWRQKRIRLGIG